MGSRLNAQDQRKGPHYCLAEMYDLRKPFRLFIPVLGPSFSNREVAVVRSGADLYSGGNGALQ